MVGCTVKKRKEEYQNLVSLQKPRVYGIDLDGVCFKFLKGFAGYLKEKHDILITDNNLTNYWWTGIDQELLDKIWKVYFHDFCREGHLRNLEVISGADIGLKLLKDMGNTLHFVTSRESYVEEDTIHSIENLLGIENPSVHIVPDKKKSPYVHRLGLDVFIDDAPSTLTDLICNTRAQVYIMDYPYNQQIVEGNFARRVSSWQQFLEAEGWIKNA